MMIFDKRDTVTHSYNDASFVSEGVFGVKINVFFATLVAYDASKLSLPSKFFTL